LRQLGVADDAEHVNPHGGPSRSAIRSACRARGLLDRGAWFGKGARPGALATMCVGVGQGVSLALSGFSRVME